LTLTGTNSYSGGSNVNGGTLQIGDGLTTNGAFGTGQYNLATGAELYLNYATAVPSSNGWSSNISGSGTVVLNSAQAVNGSANWGPNSATATVFYPSFTGTLQIDNGRIDISPAGLGGVSNIIVNGGIVSSGQFLAWSGVYDVPITIAGNGWGETGEPGALRAAGGAVTTWAGPITLTANAGISAQDATSFTLTGPITGNYQVEFETATGFPGTINLVPSGTSQNSYGSTQVDKGATVIAGNQYAFSTGGLLMNGGVLELDGFNASFANLSGTSGTIGNYGGAAATITVGADNSSTAYGASLVDGNGGAALALEKIGSGELVLSPGAPGNTYSGGTNVEAGTLILASATALADGSSLTVGQGASSLFAPAYAGPVTSAAGQVAAVPEPGTLVLLLAAALWSVVACYRFSRRKMN
jgi:autotransporter-associated beta strand protein